MAIAPPPRPMKIPQRQNMMSQLGLNLNKSGKALPGPVIQPKESSGNGLFDIPIVGPIIDFVDTPRAMIVSAIKEIGDIGKDDQSFSVGEWAQQSRDNMMMGEVLRDWDVDPGGWQGFALGLGLDVALDPLTYMAGAGLLARGAKAADVANGLRKAAKAAEAAGDAAKAAGMLKAAQRVDRTKSVLSAGKYLDDIGISSGARFTIPGTGKLGRTFIEKPLRTIFPAVGRKLDDMRVRQLLPGKGGGKAGPGGLFRWGDETNQALDLTKPHNLKLVRQRLAELRGQKGAVAPINRGRVAAGTEADKAARLAKNMAVEMPGSARVLAKIPGNAAFVGAIASTPGKVFGAAASTRMGQTFGKAFSTDVNVNAMIRSSDIVEQVNGRWIQRIGQTANTRSSTFAMAAKTGAENLKRKAAKEGIDFDDLMLAAENETSFLISQGNKFGIEPKAMALREEARAYLDGLRTLVNDALPYSDDLGDVVGELYLMRYIGREGAEKLDELGRLRGKSLPKNVTADEMVQGNSFIGRNWITPRGMKEIIRQNIIDIPQLRAQLGISDEIAEGDELVREIVRKLDAEEGFRITDRDGHVYTNQTQVGTFKDIDKAGSIRIQLSKMGKEAHGDTWVDIFDTDMTKGLTQYIDSHARYIRSQYVVDGLAQRGIVVRGANGQLSRKAATRLTAQTDRAGRSLSRAQIAKEKVEAAKAAQAKNLDYYMGEAGQAGSKTSKAAAVKAANEIAVLEGEMEAIASVMRAIQNGSGVEGLSKDALDLISPGGAYDLRRGVGYISQKVRQTADEVARLHAARSDAVEMIHALDDQVHQLEEMLKRIEAVQGINPELQGFIPLFDSYKEIQDMVNVLREGLRNFKSTFINHMMDDVTVRAADDLEDFLNVMSADELFDFARNGKMLASKARKDKLGRISRRLGQIFKDNPKWEKWLEDMPELVELKRLIGGLDEGDLGILARLDRYRTAQGGKALLDGESPIGTAVAELLGDISGAERNLLNAKLREIEEILNLGLANQGTKAADNALQETFEILGAKFEGLETAMGAAQKKLLETEAYLAKNRAIHRARVQKSEAELRRLGKTEQEIREELGKRGFNELSEDEFSRMMGVIGQQQKIIDDLKLEKMRILDSDKTSVRISAADSQQAAVAELRKVRNQHNLSDAYGGRLNEYMVTMSGLGNARDVSNRTNSLLRGYSLVGGAGEGSVELFSAAVQAAARTADTQAMSGFMKGYGTFLNWWKAQAISTPGFILRNMMGGMWINNQIADVPMGLHGRVLGIRRAAAEAAEAAGRPDDIVFGVEELIRGGKSIRLKGKFGAPQVQGAVPVDELKTFLGWYRTGMSSSGQVSQEVKSALDVIGAGGEGAWRAGSWNPFKADFKPFAQIRSWNQDAEFMLRGAVAHHTTMGGGSIDDAFELVNKYHFDYANLTQTERKMKQVIPFWTWQKNILPVLVESIGKKPAAWGRLGQIKKELELHSPEEGFVPSWFGENMGIRLPFELQGNRAYSIPDLPFRDLAKWSKGITDKEPWRPLVESVMPMYKLPIELSMGKQYFGNIPFTGRYQQVPYAYEHMPGLMPILNSLGYAKKNNKGDWKVTDKTIYFLDQFSPVLGRLRRLAPNEKSKQERIVTTWVTTFMGMNLRPNTLKSRRGALIEQQKEMAEMLRDMKDIENRRV